MKNNSNCKGCSSSVHLSIEDIYEIIKDTEKDLKGNLVDESIYKRRLEICKGCQDLLYNTTCRYSGFIVYVLAKEEDVCCQKPGKGKW